ncbi:MAG: hypothetical protein Kow0037_30750 [Calditrichia bacterium]
MQNRVRLLVVPKLLRAAEMIEALLLEADIWPIMVYEYENDRFFVLEKPLKPEKPYEEIEEDEADEFPLILDKMWGNPWIEN